MENKEKFYIFMDIDGVLWDWSWRLKAIKDGEILNKLQIEQFNPESVKALNYLLFNLEKKYDCCLVVSSSWRGNMEKTIDVLMKNKVNLTGKTLATPIFSNPKNRGGEIFSVVKKNNIKNFVIIDDETFNFNEKFEQKNIIKTNLSHGSLKMDDVSTWLKQQSNKTECEQIK